MIVSGLEANKMLLRPTALFTNNGLFKLHCVTLYCFFSHKSHNLISPLDRPITAGFP